MSSLSPLLLYVAVTAMGADAGPTPEEVRSLEVAKQCAAQGFDAFALAGDPSRRHMLDGLEQAGVGALARHAACLSALGPDAACSKLDKEAAAECELQLGENRFIFAVLRGDGQAACVASLTAEGRARDAAEKGCRTFLAAVKGGDATKACGELRGLGLLGKDASCAEEFGWWSGSRGGCATIADAWGRSWCQQRADFALGLRNPAKCEASPECKAFTQKSAQACARTRVLATKAVCAWAQGTSGKLITIETKRREAMKAAETGEAVRRKKEAESLRVKEAADRKKERPQREQFAPNEPMKKTPDELKEFIKAIEEGRPPPKLKPKSGDEQKSE